MKRCVLLACGSSAVAILIVAVLSPALGDSLWRSSSTQRVTLDGRSFLRDGSGNDDFTFLKREFGKFGVDVSGDIGTPESGEDPHPVFSGRLVEVPAAGRKVSPPLPSGLSAEHHLGMESGTGTVELLFGKLEGRGPSIRNRLTADGWTLFSTGEDAGRIRILEKTTGKEKAVVCLDEAEGAFLLIRESSR